ncbi:MAG: DUF2232 domain-containing protein [Rhodoblastus sp.]|nr:DUF2232 domain-containing protein [Rhodoblastus sp.]MCC2099546.1 DUF2232 domain-containing protein [Hyphomicrobiales bacterium]MCO5086981.1 DUF2232 domain-containing protein [Methylobacteriaceae bacterium]
MTDTKLKTYGASALVAVAAGLAAALLFVLAARASAATVAIGYFAPMPLMIAALGYGLSVGAAAAAVGAAFVATLYHPALGLLYLASIGAPAVLVAAAALLAPTRADQGGRDFAPTAAVLTAALVAATAIAGGLAFFTWRMGGFDALLASAVKEGRPIVEAMLKDAKAPGAMDAERLTRFLVMAAPVGIAASQILSMTINLYLAGRVSLISGNLPRAWPAIADDLAIPRMFGALFAAAFGLAFVGGLAGVVAAIVAAVFGMAFALQGLAVAHVLTRGSNLRPAWLFSLYGLIVLLPPWPFLFLALAGLADAAFHLRARKQASRSTN